MRIKKFHVDAFANEVFQGNSAAVCLLDEFLDDELMTNIAEEHNLSETAFVVRNSGQYNIRWFTPGTEVPLCGHATLAAAFVIFNFTDFDHEVLHFHAKIAGDLFVRQSADQLIMNFPVDVPEPVMNLSNVDVGVPNRLEEILKGKTKYLAVLNSEKEVRELDPNLNKLLKLDLEGVIFTAPSANFDFVSRFFCPKIGIDEDPVTGSAHTVLAPYWASRLKNDKLVGRQVSSRGGTVACEMKKDRVELSDTAKLYSIGEIVLE